VTHCKPLVQLSRGSGAAASRIRLLRPIPAPCTPRIAYIIIQQLRAQTRACHLPRTHKNYPLIHPNRYDRFSRLLHNPNTKHSTPPTLAYLRVAVAVNLEGSAQSSCSGLDENLSSLVSGYFWHITDIHYDANYVATADYAQRKYIIVIYYNIILYYYRYDIHLISSLFCQ